MSRIRMADEIYAIARRQQGLAAAADLAAHADEGTRAGDVCRTISDVLFVDIDTLLSISAELEGPEDPPSQHAAEESPDRTDDEPETPVE